MNSMTDASPTRDHNHADEPAGRELAAWRADPWWWSPAMTALHTLAASGQTFTAADLPAMGVPPADHRTRFGALFSAAYRSGLIEVAGARIIYRDNGSSFPLRSWVGTAHARATFDPATA